MPTSVLLAVLAAAGLLALAPALVRRYDATERLAAERAASTARVIDRARRRRTVPGARPINPPRSVSAMSAEADPPPVAVSIRRPVKTQLDIGRAEWLPIGSRVQDRRTASSERGRRPGVSPAARRAPARPPARRPTQNPAIYRRRRVLTALVALNVAEVIGVVSVSPGFWSGFAVTAVLLVAYVVHLRNEALADRRRRRVAARRAAEIAFVQAEIRAEHTKRVAARREALRRAAAARSAAQREATRLSQRFVDFDPARGARVRGRAYETGNGQRAAGE